MKKGDPICCGRPCTVTDGILWGILLLAVFVTSLVCILVVYPYNDQQEGDYKNGQCLVQTVQGGDLQVCSASDDSETPAGCSNNQNRKEGHDGSEDSSEEDSSEEDTKEDNGSVCTTFPCYQVRTTVTYESGDDSKEDTDESRGTPQPPMLYSSVETAHDYPQCSYSACNQNSEENAQTVNDWVAGYEDKQKTGEQFDCYYDPQQPEQVFAGKVFSDSEVIHAAVWPSLVALVCILALIGRRAYFSCCKKSNGIMAREAPYAVSTPEETKSKIQDPEKDPAQLGPEVVAEANAPPLELKVAPQYKEMVAPPTYSQSNLHEAAKDSLPDCEA